MQNLLPGPEPTLLPAEPRAADLLAKADSEEAVKAVAAQFPSYSAAWARLAELALGASEPVTAYAYARTGYHRGLDQLRRNGWRGHGPVPWAHEPNQGFLRALNALGVAAGQIGEAEEAERCATFLRDSDPAAASALS
ncbi:DUF3151 domain-containing protein [Dactylosporangium matsuzakiense]|uniref:DUF3151 domain-containing protein n=1 Tax=Dactylosporangium matsuzakiense TaxID=53360 RepID=A0A9W6KN47_9ACTN|nr:DUF3151 domain-containing protein [Dactylosporangium matsuzakiense]UWZ44928.1 DUF3151 domain-containing protein [Dactylosporangium matsuzakiense]GLL03589.1 hypothetical protein GCM10017581_053350 [Dactylosporangium matsuzakiense]